MSLFASAPAWAGTSTWDGNANGNKNSWSDSANWNPNSVPANNGTSDLIFSGSNRLSHTMDSAWNIKSLTFSNNAGNFTITGTDTLTIGNGVTNNDAGTQTLNMDIALGGAQTWTSSTGLLVIGSEAANRSITNSGHTLTLDGAGDFTFNAQFNGSGGLVKNGSGTARLFYGRNTDPALSVYTGATTINAGTLIADLGSTDGSPLTPLTGMITIGGGATSARLETHWSNQIGDNTTVNVLSNGTFEIDAASYNGQFPSSGLEETIGNLNVSGGSLVQTVSGTTSPATLVLNGNIAHDGLGQGTAVIDGNLSLGGTVKTISVADGPGGTDLQITATISNGGITKTGDGTLLLSGNNSYDGTTTLSGGTTIINGNQSAANGDVIVEVGATLAGTGTIGGDTTVFGTHAVGGDGLSGTQTFAGDLTYASGSIFSWNINSGSSDTVAVGGALTFEDDVIFQIVVGDDVDLQAPFWNDPQAWSSIFTGFTSGGFIPAAVQVVNGNGGLINTSGLGHFSVNGGAVTWTANPEPSSAVVGMLLVAGLFRRRRV
jgi:fibronectin-binding autotransporter adhesin